MISGELRRGPTVLLVEDMPAHAEELVAGLREEGYCVDTRGAAEEAIRALESADYAALLLDIELPLGEADEPKIPSGTPPERAGIEVLRYLRGPLGLTDLPVLVVSGLDHRAFWSNMVHELKSDELHVAAIMVKPTGPREVIHELALYTGWKGPLFRAFRADDPNYGD